LINRYPRAETLDSAGLYEAKSAKYAPLPRHLLKQIAEAGLGTKREGLYFRWDQTPVAGNHVLRIRLRNEAYFAPHREYAQKQLTLNAGKKSASISTLELPSTGFSDVRPPDSMWSRIGVYHWPQIFYAWVEGENLYVRKVFNGDELRKVNADGWEFFHSHPKARVFSPVDVVRATLFFTGSLTPKLQEKFIQLRREFAGIVRFRMVNVDHDTFDGARYCVDTLPCLYAEIEETSQLTRLTGRLSLESMNTVIRKYL
jgi:hypothetical protein